MLTIAAYHDLPVNVSLVCHSLQYSLPHSLPHFLYMLRAGCAGAAIPALTGGGGGAALIVLSTVHAAVGGLVGLSAAGRSGRL
jgi:hypothetical protein